MDFRLPVFRRPPDGLSVAVLAGGLSRRMGADKALLTLDGRTLLDRAIGLALAAGDDVMLVGRALDDGSVHLPPGLRPVPDGPGPRCALRGLIAALAAARHRWLWALACDMPFLSPTTLSGLLAARRPGTLAAVLSWHGRLLPLGGLYERALARRAEARLAAGELRLTTLLESLGPGLTTVETSALGLNETELLNLNTPEDYRKARRRTGEQDRTTTKGGRQT